MSEPLKGSKEDWKVLGTEAMAIFAWLSAGFT